jgi:hypothetical protein
MGKVIVDLSMSLDGYIAGPNDGRGNPLRSTEIGPVELKQTRVVESEGVTRVRYRVVR